MNTKNDGPGKDSGRPAEGGDTASKKPYATIDLKATEVKSETKPSAAADAAKDAAAKAAQSVPPVGAKPGDAKPLDPKATTASATAGKPGDAKPTDPKVADPKAAAAKPDPKTDPAKSKVAETTAPKRSGSGVGGFFTHMAAGIVGGFLALLGADTIGEKLHQYLPELGLPAGGSAALNETTSKLQARMAELEQSVKQGRAADLASKLAATEATLKEVRQTQGKLVEDSRALAERVGKQTGGDVADARVVKLEEKLAALSAAAETDPQKGRIPQLAALTGKVSDLEATVNNQMAAVRKSIAEQIDARVGGVAEASEAAKAGAQRIDRDVSGLKSETARLRSDGERTAAALKIVQEDTAGMRGSLEALKSDVDAKLRAAAKPADVSAAVAPVAGKLAALEGNVAAVVKSEDSRKANAERIVLSLELGNLKRVIDRGSPFAAELAEVRKAGGNKIDLSALDRFKDKGVATIADLTREFRTIANGIIDAEGEPANAGVIDRLLSGAKSVVRVRKVSQDASDTGVEATVARMEAAVKEGRLADVLSESKKLSGRASVPAQDWLTKVEARNTVERAIGGVEASLKASLASGIEPAAPEKK